MVSGLSLALGLGIRMSDPYVDTGPYHTLLDYTVLDHTILYRTIICHAILYCVISLCYKHPYVNVGFGPPT